MSVWLIPFNLPILIDLLFFFVLFLLSLVGLWSLAFIFTLFFCLSISPSRSLILLISLLSQVVTDRKNRDTEWGQRGTEGFIKPWRAGRFQIWWLVQDRRRTHLGGGLAPRTSKMSRRRSTGDLVPRDITEILAREARAQRGQKKSGSSLGQAFSWLKGSRKKKSITHGLKQTGIGVMDAKMGLQNHEPVKGE